MTTNQYAKLQLIQPNRWNIFGTNYLEPSESKEFLPYLYGFGGKALAFFLNDPIIVEIIENIAVIAGHVVIVVNGCNSTTICVFDTIHASPENSAGSLDSNFEGDIKKSIQFLKSKHCPNQVTKQIDRAHEEALFDGSLILCHVTSSSFVRILFDKELGSGSLQLLAITRDGRLFMWEWIQGEASTPLPLKTTPSSFWQILLSGVNLHVPQKIPSTFLDSSTKISIVKVKDIAYSRQYGSLVWWEENDGNNRVYSNSLTTKNSFLPNSQVIEGNMRRLGVKKKKIIVELGNSIFVESISAISFIGATEGVWFITADSILFWSFRKQLLYNAEIPTLISNNSFSTILPPFIHPYSSELAVIDTTGHFFICSLDLEGKIRSKYLYNISPFNRVGIVKIFFSYNNLICLQQQNICFYDTYSGNLVNKEALPFLLEGTKLWQSYSDGPLGFWTSSGALWELKHPAVTKQMQVIAQQKQANSVIALCKSWSLFKRESKYLLEFVISQIGAPQGSDENMLKSLQKRLLSYLESPALLVGLLSQNCAYNKVLDQHLSRFLALKGVDNAALIPVDEVQSSTSKNIHEESIRLALRSKFHIYTPLNKVVTPLLEDFYRLSTQNRPYTKSGLKSTFPSISDPFQFGNENTLLQLLEMSRSDLELFALQFPHLCLTTLEGALFGGFSFEQAQNSEPIFSELIFNQEEVLSNPKGTMAFRSPQHPFFELLCRLYYIEKPHCVLPFINLVIQYCKPERPTESESFFERALLILPPLDPIQKGHEHLKVWVKLLCKAGHFTTAIQVLLKLEEWEYAIKLLDKKYKSLEDKTQLETFHLLLTHCFQRKMFQRCKDIWRFMPKSFTILNILKLIQKLDTPINQVEAQKSPILFPSDSTNFTVSIFKEQMMQMLKSK